MAENNKIESTLVLNQFVVRDSDGNVDMDQTLAKFSQALTVWDAHYRADLDSTLKAIAAVYDRNKTDVLPSGYVVNQAAGLLLGGAEFSPEAFNMAAERIQEVLKTSGQFESKKGRDGGTKFKNAAHKKAETTETAAA